MARNKKSEERKNAAAVKPRRAKNPRWPLPFILLITFLAFIPVLRADFVNLDDGEYVTNNPLLQNLSGLKSLLTTPVQGNHHSLTMLSLAINFMISGLEAWSYHLLNLVLHLVNCFLVFRLAMLLSNKNTVIAFATAVLFGIHPMHVESVAWVSERKDVLYGLFFLAGLISYTKYVDIGSKIQNRLTILFLALSLLSKPAAVIFPVTLFCIDLLRNRTLTFKLLREKIPLFALALIMGIATILGQRAVGATGEVAFGALNRIFFGLYGFMMYVFKMIVPLNLAVFYGFPPVNESLPVEYYLAPLFFVAVGGLVFYSWENNRVIAFGVLFYLVNLLLVLQFLPVGGAVIADRYTYIPYIGLFYIIGWLIDRYTRGNTLKANFIILTVALPLFVMTSMQASVWINSTSLWDHAIKTQPSNKSYANRAMLFRKERNYARALEYYDKAIKLNTIDYESYANRGNVYFDLNKPDLAINDYRKALSLKSDYYPALDNMGAQSAMRGDYNSALEYSSRALSIKPDYKPAYSNRALTYMKLNRYEEAIIDWKKFLEYEPNAADVYNTIGSCYQAMGKYQESLAPINKSIELSHDPAFYLNRSYAYNALQNTEAAKSDALMAKQGGIQLPDKYAKSLGIR